MNLENKLREMQTAVMKLYPDAVFYEAQCVLLTSNDGTMGPDVDPLNTRFVYNQADSSTIIVTFDADGNPEYEYIPRDPWFDDRPFLPFIPMTVKDAIEVLNTANFILETPIMTLRFPLKLDTTEPQYIFTLDRGLFAKVGVYTGTVSVEKNGVN
ncbi:MAG: hypothetical protein LUD72_04350 [Bacteroidales bacterium]|nr:hypothetical protein [Bacteroidales bacterium]